MAIPRKLSDQDQRYVALAYLCSIPVDILKKEWKVSEATINGNILGKYSREWNDGLVEFYRKTPSHGRERNAAHMYLVHKGVAVEGAGLVDDTAPVFSLVYNQFIAPQAEQLKEQFSLERLLFSTTKAERILSCSFRRDYPDTLAEDFVLKSVLKAYSGDGRFSFYKVHQDARSALVQTIKYGGFGLTETKKQAIASVLASVDGKVGELMRMAFADFKFPQEIAKEMGWTRQKYEGEWRRAYHRFTRSAEGKLVQKLFASLLTDEQVLALLSRKDELLDSMRKKDPYILPDAPQLREILVNNLELSVRVNQCLRSLHMKTVGDVYDHWEKILMRVGRSGWREVNDVLTELAGNK